jgi:hypothetical protein
VADDPSGRPPFWDMSSLFRQTSGPFGGLRGFQELSTWGTRTAMEVLLERVRAGLIGRRVDLQLGDSRLSFTLSALDARLDAMGAAAGQADDVALTAEDVEWSGMQFAVVTGTLKNVHLRPGSSPSLVCAPVDLVATLSDDQLHSVLAARTARVAATCTDGAIRLRLERHLSWGWMDVCPEVVGGHVRLRPIAIGGPRRAWRPRRRLPAKSLTLRLPENTRIVDLKVVAGTLRIRLRIDQWRIEYQHLLSLARRRR